MKKELLSKKKEPSEDSKGVLHNSKATIGTRPKLLIPLSFFFGDRWWGERGEY